MNNIKEFLEKNSIIIIFSIGAFVTFFFIDSYRRKLNALKKARLTRMRNKREIKTKKEIALRNLAKARAARKKQKK